jgi:DNA primase
VKEAGGDAYRERLKNAPHYMEWLIERAAAENDTKTPQGKAAYLAALTPMLVKIESAVERAAWLPRVVQAGRLDGAAAEQELRRALSLRGGGPAAPAQKPHPRAARGLLPAEKWLLALLLREAEGTTQALGEMQDGDLEELRSAGILRTAKSLYLKGQSVGAASLGDAVSDEDDRRLLREIAVEAPPVEHSKPLDCVLELRRCVLQRKLETLQTDLRDRLARGEDARELSLEKVRLARQLANL